VTTSLEGARDDWQEGYRRYEAAYREEAHPERLRVQLDLILGELRRRVGGVFSLEELVDVYGDADAWILHLVEEHAATPGWARSVSMVGDAAFYVYARGAVDYTP
jgi:hypothetical protein